jgi:hypothetical protein
MSEKEQRRLKFYSTQGGALHYQFEPSNYEDISVIVAIVFPVCHSHSCNDVVGEAPATPVSSTTADIP